MPNTEDNRLVCKYCGAKSSGGGDADAIEARAFANGWNVDICPDCLDALRQEKYDSQMEAMED